MGGISGSWNINEDFSSPKISLHGNTPVSWEGLLIAFDGRLDDRDELSRRIDDAQTIPRNAPEAHLAAAAYRRFSDDFPRYLNGDFSLALFDPQKRRLILARDGMGMRPLYYCRRGQNFLFASEIKAILSQPGVIRKPNEWMLAEFLVNGWNSNPEGNTFFENIFSLPPAHLAVITRESFAIRRYWEFDLSREIRMKNFGEYLEAFRFHFERAVKRRILGPDPIAFTVSGGLDSSSVYCMAEAVNRKENLGFSLLPISLVPEEVAAAREDEYLAPIERMYGVRVERIPMPPSAMRGAEQSVLALEFPLVYWDPVLKLFERGRKSGARTLLTGYLGDQVMVCDGYIMDLFRSFQWTKIKKHYLEISRWMGGSKLHARLKKGFWEDLARAWMPQTFRNFLRRLRTRAIPSIHSRLWYSESLRKKARIQAWNAREPAIPKGNFHAETLYRFLKMGPAPEKIEWEVKMAASFGLDTAMPFADRDLISFVMAIPGEVTFWEGMPRALQRQGLRGILPDEIATRRSKANFTGLANKGVEREFAEIANFVESNGMAVKFGYVDPKALKQVMAGMAGGFNRTDGLYARWLSDLFALEVWLQIFFGSKNAFSHDSNPKSPPIQRNETEPTLPKLS